MLFRSTSNDKTKRHPGGITLPPSPELWAGGHDHEEEAARPPRQLCPAPLRRSPHGRDDVGLERDDAADAPAAVRGVNAVGGDAVFGGNLGSFVSFVGVDIVFSVFI